MQIEPEASIFKQIMKKENALLEAGTVEGVLKLMLTISDFADDTHVYIAQIRSLDEYQKLDQYFNTIQEVLQFLKETNVMLNLREMSVTLISRVGKSILELAKVMFYKLGEQNKKYIYLKDIVGRCNQKHDLTTDEIKENFKILVKEIMILKKQQQNERFEGLKQEILVPLKELNNKKNEENEKCSQSCYNEMMELKKEYEAIKKQSFFQQYNLQQLYDKIEKPQKCLNMEKSLKKNVNPQKEIHPLIEISNDKLKQIETGSVLSQKVQKISSRLNYSHISLSEQKQSFLQKPQSFIQKPHSLLQKLSSYRSQKQAKSQKSFTQLQYENQFRFDSKTLTKLNDKSWKQFVFLEEKIGQDQFVFKIKIVRSQNRHIFIGVIDYDKQRFASRSYNSNNALSYYAYNGYKWPEKEYEGNGVFDGETVEVRVERKSRTIKWIVNGKLRASSVKDMLRDKDRTFYPYVEMYHSRDTIQFVME